MPSLNFKGQFASAVQDGRKTQTIRATRKAPIKVGDKLYLYTGMRTKACSRLLVARCTRVRGIVISMTPSKSNVCLDGRDLSAREINRIALADGFRDSVGFFCFFCDTRGFLFSGQLIEWRAI